MQVIKADLYRQNLKRCLGQKDKLQRQYNKLKYSLKSVQNFGVCSDKIFSANTSLRTNVIKLFCMAYIFEREATFFICNYSLTCIRKLGPNNSQVLSRWLLRSTDKLQCLSKLENFFLQFIFCNQGFSDRLNLNSRWFYPNALGIKLIWPSQSALQLKGL